MVGTIAGLRCLRQIPLPFGAGLAHFGVAFSVLPGRSIVDQFGREFLRERNRANKDNQFDEGGPLRWHKSKI